MGFGMHQQWCIFATLTIMCLATLSSQGRENIKNVFHCCLMRYVRLRKDMPPIHSWLTRKILFQKLQSLKISFSCLMFTGVLQRHSMGDSFLFQGEMGVYTFSYSFGCLFPTTITSGSPSALWTHPPILMITIYFLLITWLFKTCRYL